MPREWEVVVSWGKVWWLCTKHPGGRRGDGGGQGECTGDEEPPPFRSRDLGDGNLCWPAVPWRPKFKGESLTRERLTVMAKSKFIPELLLVKPSKLAGTCVTFLSWVIFQLGMEFYQGRGSSNLRMHLIWDRVVRSIRVIVCLPFPEEYSGEVQLWPPCCCSLLSFLLYFLSSQHPVISWWPLCCSSQWLIGTAGHGHRCWANC